MLREQRRRKTASSVAAMAVRTVSELMNSWKLI